MVLKIVSKFLLLSLIFCINATASEMVDLRYERLEESKQSEDSNEKDIQEIQVISNIIGKERIDDNKRIFNLSKRLWLSQITAFKIPDKIATKLSTYVYVFNKRQGQEIKERIDLFVIDNRSFFNCTLNGYNEYFKILGFVQSVSGLLIKTEYVDNKYEYDEYGNVISRKHTKTPSYFLVITNNWNFFQNLTTEEENIISILDKLWEEHKDFITYKKLANEMGKSYSEIFEFMKAFKEKRPKGFILLEDIFYLRDFGEKDCCCAIM